MSGTSKKGSFRALIPFLIFIFIYLGAGIFHSLRGTEMAFYQFPVVAALLIGVLAAFLLFRGSIDENFRIFAKGAANEDILTMLVIFMLAGAFSNVAAEMGGRDATVNLGLSVIPADFLAAGIFIISAFMGTATGTSMGAISAIVPIAVGVADKSGLSIPLVVGACVGGAMFGDNLSMISDTTIASTRSQGCEMRDKFKVNVRISLPAAAVTVLLLFLFGKPETAAPIGELSFRFIKVVPYLAVLILALAGLNVFLVLTSGILISGAIGIFCGDLTISAFAQSVYTGVTNMDEIFYLSLLMGGLAELTAHNGGIEWITGKLKRVIKGQKSAQLGIAAFVSLVDCAVANNTVAIIVSGNMAKKISREYKVDPRRTASLLSIFSCVFQGIIPYSAQPLTAAALAVSLGYRISPMDILPYVWYCALLAVFGILSVFVPFADGLCRKDPWNWEHDRAESRVRAGDLLPKGSRTAAV